MQGNLPAQSYSLVALLDYMFHQPVLLQKYWQEG